MRTYELRVYGSSEQDAAGSDNDRPGDYLNVAADSGGIESFWGQPPWRPGGSKDDREIIEGSVSVELARSIQPDGNLRSGSAVSKVSSA
jgi:hypothetical protein